MVYCRVCKRQWKNEKWFLDKELDVYRRTCCLRIVPDENLRQQWKDEIKYIKERYLILKEGLENMTSKKETEVEAITKSLEEYVKKHPEADIGKFD